MKTKTGKLILSLALILSIGFVVSCSDDGGGSGSNANKTVLAASVAEAELLLENTDEGFEEGEYLTGSKEELQDILTIVEAVLADNSATQAQVDNANANLQLAIASYESKVIIAIEPTAVIASWKFDEGTGTTVTDDSGNGHNGTLTAGHSASGGGGIPTWATDRRGTAAKALHFTGGGHALVPEHVDFGPTEITIAVWVRLDSLNTSTGIYGDNYIVSQNDYHGYKFQTETNKYPFFTANSGVDGPFIDRAASTNIPLRKWVHLAVTFKTNEMKFFIDGVDVTKPLNDGGSVSGGFGAFPRYDFVIGQAMPNAEVPEDITWVLAHFEGTMDDLKMYNKALSGSQIATMYLQEKF